MQRNYNFAFLDEGSKREIRRAILKAVAIPGYQVRRSSRAVTVSLSVRCGAINSWCCRFPRQSPCAPTRRAKA